MTTCLWNSRSFGLPRVPFVNCCQFNIFSYFPLGFEVRIWDLSVSVPDHCLSFYFVIISLGGEGADSSSYLHMFILCRCSVYLLSVSLIGYYL